MSAPTAAELQSHPTIRDALEQAWQDSLPDDPARRHKEGGWIYMDITTGEIAVRRQAAGRQASIDLSSLPILPDFIVVGKFHTHPNPSSEGWAPGPRPSRRDLKVDAIHGVPDLIRADNGVHMSGPGTWQPALSRRSRALPSRATRR